MKRLISLIILVFLIGCEKVPTYEELAIEKVKEKLLDPNSFELIKIERDTTKMSDYCQTLSQLRIALADQSIAKAGVEADKAKMYYIINSKKSKEFARNARKYLQEAQEIINEADKFDSIKNSVIGTENDSILAFDFFVRGYAMSRGGNKSIGDWKASFDENYEFLELISLE